MSKLKTATELLGAALMAGIVIIVLVQVVARYLLQLSTPWSEELARFMLVWLAFIGAAAATARGRHIVIDTVVGRVSGRVRHTLAIVATAGVCIALGAFLVVSAPLFGPAGSTIAPGSGFEVRWVRLALPVGVALALMFTLVTLVELVSGRRRDLGRTIIEKPAGADSPPEL